MDRTLVVHVLVLLGLTGLGVVTAQAAGPEPARRAELVRMVRQDCGSCHGMRMTGGLGPPLTREALTGKPIDFLVATVLHGRPGTPMPPWRGQLTDDEAAWLVDRLVEGLKP